MAGKVWKLMKGRWAGITATGKRISIAKTKAQAESRAGISSKSRASKPKTKRRKKRNPIRRVRRTGRRRKKRRGGKSLQKTVFKWLRIASIFAPEIAGALQRKPAERIFADMIYDKTGYNMADGTWNIARLAKGWGPFLGTCLATYGIPKLVGIIRRI